MCVCAHSGWPAKSFTFKEMHNIMYEICTLVFIRRKHIQMNTSVRNNTMCGGRWAARELRLISRPCILPSRLANFCHVLPTCWNTPSASLWWCFSESLDWLAHQQGSFHLKQPAFEHTATRMRGQLAPNAWVAVDWRFNASLIAQRRVNAYVCTFLELIDTLLGFFPLTE